MLSAHGALSRLKALKLSIPEKYYTYVLEQASKQSKADSGGAETNDMASYAQFEKTFR